MINLRVPFAERFAFACKLSHHSIKVRKFRTAGLKKAIIPDIVCLFVMPGGLLDFAGEVCHVSENK